MWEWLRGLAKVAAKRVPVFLHIVLVIWKPIGSLKFGIAYRNACRNGNVCLHIGAGAPHLDGWLNTDILPLASLFLDAAAPFPIKDDSVSYIFSEQFIEHISRDKALGFFQECFRVLKPGGVLRTSTPDAEALAKAYLNYPERTRLLNERSRRLGYQYSQYPVDILNKMFLEDKHVCLYDAQVFQQMLSSVGFQNVTYCTVGKSEHKALSKIEQHDVGSIVDEFICVVEATKPSL